MRILTRKQQDEIIKRLCANEIIFESQNTNPDNFMVYVDNSTEIVALVGGAEGFFKFLNTTKKYINDRQERTSEIIRKGHR